jgi:NAD(P)-dependent dehydrogenase (short-subunit alcohol dehydrogenase family)
MNVSNKTIVVTGGGNGMGRELTLLLLKKKRTCSCHRYPSGSP